ncbi:MAG: peptide chain release factor 2 [Candidatus Magasanikbacteria bacterium]
MKEEKKKLNELKEKIQSTWALLGIDGQIAKMHGLEKEMQGGDFWSDQENAKRVSQEHEEYRIEVETWTQLKTEVEELVSLCVDLEKEPDEGMEAEVRLKIEELEKQFEKLEFYLLLDGKHDKKNAIVAVHSGSGGIEAQDWAEMLLRMVLRYCDKQGYKTTILDESRGSEAGIKSTVFLVEGRWAFGHLKSEHGTHRLVRISPFDAEKMRHTSFALIEVIPELECGEEVTIDPKDLRIDTFMSGGKGGQSVNTTYSAVRIVHIPTGITVSCQNERSQLQNKEISMKVLQSKLQTLKEEEEEKEKKKLRGEYKSAEWGNQIRSYVLHPYKMVKDLRSRYEESDPDAVLDGDLSGFVEAYLRYLKSEV